VSGASSDVAVGFPTDGRGDPALDGVDLTREERPVLVDGDLHVVGPEAHPSPSEGTRLALRSEVSRGKPFLS
jgi:hypothetical protein